MTLWAFRVGEDSRVLLPVMVHFDGFSLSHVTEPVILPEQEEVDRFLPEFHYPYALNPDKPMTKDELVEKFFDCSELLAKPIDKSDLEQVVDLVVGLEKVDDATRIIKLLVPGRK